MPSSFKKHTLIISLLLHGLLLLSFVHFWRDVVIEPEKKPAMYVPSYTTQEQSVSYQSPAPQPVVKPQPETPVKEVPPPPKADEQALRIEKPVSKAMQLKHASKPSTNTSTKVTEAINLVGDKKTMPKPLIILLGKALTAKLAYPKSAIEFRIRGTAYVAFMLHPDGTITDVEVVQSSLAGVLDTEAAHAVRAISPLKDVGQYVPKTKPMVIGIIFN